MSNAPSPTNEAQVLAAEVAREAAEAIRELHQGRDEYRTATAAVDELRGAVEELTSSVQASATQTAKAVAGLEAEVARTRRTQARMGVAVDSLEREIARLAEADLANARLDEALAARVDQIAADRSADEAKARAPVVGLIGAAAGERLAERVVDLLQAAAGPWTIVVGALVGILAGIVWMRSVRASGAAAPPPAVPRRAPSLSDTEETVMTRRGTK